MTFKMLYMLVFIAHGRRESVHVNVTANPTAGWVWWQIIEATPWARNHGICSAIATPSVAAIFGGPLGVSGIDAIATPIHAPKAKTYASNCSLSVGSTVKM
jgi:hypothetical protein